MKKLFFAVCVVAFAGNAYASDLKLPIGECLLKFPERGNWCGILTVGPKGSMQYIGGDCHNGKMDILYKARSITLRGNEITIDGKYHVEVTWLSPLGKQANVTFRYSDDTGEHSGNRSLVCG